ncbi:MAG: DeoR/GlpR family DNA-binding transcription regulator [Candidatus Izemoplasmataceae bacterium]
MQKSKRLSIIKDYLRTHKDIRISDLNGILDVSESTIRRDIKNLADEGFLKELYGSVVLLEKNQPDTFLKERLEQNIDAKKTIGREAASRISDGDFIYIDAGSTTFHMVKYITAKNLTVVTNGHNIAEELLKYDIPCILLGGELKPLTLAVVGEIALENLRHYNFDVAFMGTNGISKAGYSTPDIKEGTLKKEVIAHSRKRYVLSDQTKMNLTTAYIFSDRESCELITA